MKKSILIFIIVGGLFWGYYNFGKELVRPVPEQQFASGASNAETTDPTVTALNNAKNGSIILGGDIMLARSVESYAKANGGWSQVFSQVKDTLGEYDCRVANLESPFISGKPQTQISSMVFAAKPEAVEALTGANITAVSLANNHITDQGLAGLTETQSLLKSRGIVYGGAGRSADEAIAPQSIRCGELKVGLVFATYGTNFAAEGVVSAPLEDITPSITKAKKDHDIVAVIAHWGGEYQELATPFQKELAHRYIDAGADLVIGSHPHVIQPIEKYKGKLIAYSLGNFVFDQAASGNKTEAILVSVSYSDSATTAKVVPIKIEKYFRPTIVPAEKAATYFKRLNIENWEFQLTDR